MSSSIEIDRLIIIDQDLCENKQFIDALQSNFNIKIETICDLYNSNGFDEHAENILYISSSFEGPLFEKLLSKQKPVISHLIVEDCIRNRITLPLPKHPLFNYFMKDYVICFSIDDKRKTRIINKYLNLIRFMGGQSRRDMNSGKSFERTHLIESKTDSVNYRLASIYGLPILSKEWIDHFWEHRLSKDFDPNDPELMKYRIKPLTDLRITLYNFTPDEITKKTELIIEQGGHSVPLYDRNCTHLVIKNDSESDYLNILENFDELPKFIISEKWLDSTIKLNYRDKEESYLLKIPLSEKIEIDSTPTKDDHPTLNSILLSPNYDNSIDDSSFVDKNDLKKQAITQELYQTELNYVNILKDIIKIFREPLRNHQLPGQFPNDIELKTMFDGLLPIIAVHEKILNELEPVVKNWKAENEIGKIFQAHSAELIKVYPQYVNYYEKTKETIEHCIMKYPKFDSFLKAGEASQECKKQTFKELLINPIQRLPRIELYLRTLLDRTDKLHPDYKLLNESLDTIISVNNY
ncbi:hypothetical protein SSS_05543 [Sarcoptes scabiei]|nr:hypothetical protein SSS_05543 [Sarcoptes scabiei]